MKKKEKRRILLLILAAIIIIAVLIGWRNKKNKEVEEDLPTTQEEVGTEAPEEFVKKEEDGTKVNISNQLAETKIVGNYEISNIKLTEKDGETLLLADVKNIGDTKLELTFIKITYLDKEGNEIATTEGAIADVEPGEVVSLSAAGTMDFANAYDFKIELK